MSGGRIDPVVRSAIATVATSGRLLVATDYDGTLSPIVLDPGAAAADPRALAALTRLARIPATSVAVLSGRGLADLMTRCPLEPPIELLGSHGAETRGSLQRDHDPSTNALLTHLMGEVTRVAEGRPGVVVETKPWGAAVHWRRASRAVATQVSEALHAGPAQLPGVHVLEGSEVLELSVVPLDKGTALDRLRRRTDAWSVVFLGDDRTDENAFARLGSRDVGIKVGPGPTRAGLRVDDTLDVAEVLTVLADLRGGVIARRSGRSTSSRYA